ncbi:MAG: glutamyl-tRNA reductase [Luteolibacter sp.]
MELVCLGLNHKTASIAVRERFAVGTHKLGEASTEFVKKTGAEEGIVVSTCNRTEFYLAGNNAQAILRRLEDHLQKHVDPEDTQDHFYRKKCGDAARHLCRVASGLDSMMLGETEIFGQVKQAYQAAFEAGATKGVLNKLFQTAFRVGKKVRTETDIQVGSTSVASVAVDLAEKIFGHLKDSRVIVIGAGDTSRQTAQALMSRGASSIFVTNRSFERAEQLANEMGGKAVKFDEWQPVLAGVDVVISATGATHSVVMPFHVEAVRSVRKYRPLFFIDIAVPRDIDPAVGDIDEVYLYDIDTLEDLANEARQKRELQIKECEQIIDAELSKNKLPGT